MQIDIDGSLNLWVYFIGTNSVFGQLSSQTWNPYRVTVDAENYNLFMDRACGIKGFQLLANGLEPVED